MKPRLRIGVLGIGGRMGREISVALTHAEYADRFELAAAPERGESLQDLLDVDALIEFSSPAAALELGRALLAEKKRVPFVIGSTGWSTDQEQELQTLAKSLPILRASNFSMGVLLCRKVLSLWSGWPGIDQFQIMIRETHHTKKKDAPSGTALTLSEAISGKNIRKVPIESIREGDAIGTHEVVLENSREKISLIHEAKSRGVFATGALDAAEKFVEVFRLKTLPSRLISLEEIYSE